MELLPCPFCGGKATARQRANRYYQVQCKECYCGTSDRYESYWFAENAWNTRTPAVTPDKP